MVEKRKEYFGLKTNISIIGGIGWLIFIILWFAFYATNYSWERNLSILLLSILIIFILIGGIWAIWSIRMLPKTGWEIFKISGFKWRIITSIIVPFAAMIFLILWYWYYAEPFNVWQNIAVLLVILLILGGILGIIWTRWSIEHGNEMKKFEDIGEEIGKKMEESFRKETDEK
jgi:hypothetical protein